MSKADMFDADDLLATLESRARRCRELLGKGHAAEDWARIQGKISAYEHAAELVRDEIAR